MRPQTARRQRGASTLEWVGMVLVASFLCSGVFLAMAPEGAAVTNQVRSAICQILTFGKGECSPAQIEAKDRAPLEPCVTKAEGHDSTLSAAVVVEAGVNEKLLIETLADGTYRVTVGNGQDLGATTGAGFNISLTVDNKTGGVAAGADASAGVTFQDGKVYRARTKGEVDAIVKSHYLNVAADNTVGKEKIGIGPVSFDNPVRKLTNWVGDKTGLLKGVPEPTETFYSGGVSASAAAQATWIVSNAQAGAGVTGILGYREGKDGTTTFYEASVDANVGAGTWASPENTVSGSNAYFRAGAGGKAKVVVQVERDKAGNVTALRMTGAAGGQAAWNESQGREVVGADPSGYAELTAELKMTSGANRRVAANLLNELNMGPIPGLPEYVPNPLAGSVVAKNPITSGAAMADFVSAVKKGGTATVLTYSNDTSTYGGQFDAKWLAKVGVKGSVNTMERSVQSANYWDGSKWATWSGCKA